MKQKNQPKVCHITAFSYVVKKNVLRKKVHRVVEKGDLRRSLEKLSELTDLCPFSTDTFIIV